MYKENDVIVCGRSEVYRIKKIGVPEFARERYYWLQPLGKEESTLYVRTDSGKKMRYILTEGEARELIRGLPQMEGMYSPDSREREREYIQVFRSCECRQWLRMWKGIREERVRRSGTGRKLSTSDAGNLKKVESSIAAEFSAVFHITQEEVAERLEF